MLLMYYDGVRVNGQVDVLLGSLRILLSSVRGFLGSNGGAKY